MKVLILGATGLVGHSIVVQAVHHIRRSLRSSLQLGRRDGGGVVCRWRLRPGVGRTFSERALARKERSNAS